MNKCETCRFMAAERDHHAPDYATCVAVVHGNHAGSLSEGSDNCYYEYAEQDRKAVVLDGSCYAARLLVRKDFGCVLWEAK